MTGIKESIVVRTTLACSIVVALFFVVTVVVGMVLVYSPVPFWDMWGGTLGFYLAHLTGDTSVWWAQHNEHRIILTRVLFWLDFKLAGGSGLLLLATHPLLAGLAVYLFYLIYQQLNVAGPDHKRIISVISASALTAWLFQWMQEENFAWAFQSQFFLAQTLPLLSLYLLAKSATTTTQQTSWFAAACLAGVLSAGTMANGVITLPLMAVYAVATRQSWWKVTVLTGLAVTVLSLYFLDYQSPPTHGSVTEAIVGQPLALARYVLLYLGTPFFFLVGGQEPGMWVAMTATAFMAAASVYFLVTSARTLWSEPSADIQVWQLALVFYIIFLAGTALGTGGGRLVFGVNQALTYRYTTPALMAWAALFVLCLPALAGHWQKYRFVVTPAALLLLTLMIVLQLKALDGRQQQVFERSLAALALELDIRDEPRIRAVYEMSNGLINIVDLARRRQLSVFGQYPWRGLREQLGEIHSAPGSLPACNGYLDTMDPLEANPDIRLVQGWMINSQTRQPAELITLLDEFNIVRGFAVGGRVRPDVAAAHGEHGLNSGFGGYLTPPDNRGNLRLIADDNACELSVAALPVAAGAVN